MKHLPPISQDHDPVRRRQRMRAVTRDITLHAQDRACLTCGHTSRLRGGTGCACPVATADMLAARCHAIAAGECHCQLDDQPEDVNP